jgi:hypothetical protein
MKYDLHKCNNLNWMGDDYRKGYIKVGKDEKIYIVEKKPTYILSDGTPCDVNAWSVNVPQGEIDSNSMNLAIKGFKIMPRNPIGYIDWRIDDVFIYDSKAYIVIDVHGDVVTSKNLYDDSLMTMAKHSDTSLRCHLQPTEYEHEIEEVTTKLQDVMENLFKKGEKVIVKNSREDFWLGAEFDSYEAGNEYPFRTTCGRAFKYCTILNEGTLPLLGTNKNSVDF